MFKNKSNDFMMHVIIAKRMEEENKGFFFPLIIVIFYFLLPICKVLIQDGEKQNCKNFIYFFFLNRTRDMHIPIVKPEGKKESLKIKSRHDLGKCCHTSIL